MKASNEVSLQRTIGLWGTVSLVAGAVIGSGIFMKPALMASQLGSPVWLLSIWLVAGLMTLCGALTNAEVACMYPQTGGQYIFFREMYGDFFAFYYGWAAFAVFNTAGVASIAYIMTEYAGWFADIPRLSPEAEKSFTIYLPYIGNIHPWQDLGKKLVTVTIVIVLTLLNYRSLRAGNGLQVLVTVIKLAAMFLLVAGIFSSSAGDISNLVKSDAALMPKGSAWIPAIVAAISGAFWAYDGWNNISFVAGEVKNPKQNIPKGLLMGLSICIVTYVIINMAYLYVLPIDQMARSKIVASDAASVIMGVAGGALIAALVMISTLGATNGNILATARVSFAMARDGQFFSFAGKVHPKFRTPGNALWLHCIWTCMLVFSGSFDMLTDMLIFVSWLFYGMSAAGLFVLRKKYPNAERAYKVPGYPLVPLVFVLFTVFFIGITLYSDISLYRSGREPLIKSLFGILLTLPGIPLYFYFRRRNSG